MERDAPHPYKQRTPTYAGWSGTIPAYRVGCRWLSPPLPHDGSDLRGRCVGTGLVDAKTIISNGKQVA